jgi:hypothetical protein
MAGGFAEEPETRMEHTGHAETTALGSGDSTDKYNSNGPLESSYSSTMVVWRNFRTEGRAQD